MSKMTVKNWGEFQHYKDRRPPWIKLYRNLLDDQDFMCLPIASKALAPCLWLLASESEKGEIDGDIKKLAWRLRMTEKEVRDGLKPLIDNGFFNVASNVLADCLHDAIPETERETERETEKRSSTGVDRPECVSRELWSEFSKICKAKKKPIGDRVLSKMIDESEKAGWSLDQVIAWCCEKGYARFEADWVATKKQSDEYIPMALR